MFAIFSDLYGGEREGVFAIAMAQLELLRPELVLNVGDLINGGTEDRNRLAREWDDFDDKVAGLHAPVFYIGGNHDLTNLTMRNFWENRYGARYYHFVYKNVLFLMLDSEDYEVARMQEIYAARAHALQVTRGEIPGDISETAYFNMPERRTGAIRERQAAYFRAVIADNPDVRWTFVLMHKPLWRNEQETDFHSIETALADRPYTVINGHFHSYSLTKRHGREYIHLGTTSGTQSTEDDMSFDHVTLVTMTDQGPSIANLRLDGILDSSGHVPLDGDDVCFQASACGVADTE
jgi:3',5'-cyclic AMP phosphodiesterase CpdA